ncbi:hypothetical protein ACHQM5_010742 [Ranunculus cassubicifolius]
MINPTKEIQKLRKMETKLVAQVTHVNTMLHTNEMQQGGLFTNQAEKWLNEVRKKFDEINAVERKVKIAKRGLSGLFFKCCSHSNLEQNVLELSKEITSLLEHGAKLSSLPVSEMGMELPTRELVGETTAQKTLKMIWECLMDDQIEAIGVYGMGGIGKTAIMKVINNRLLKEHHSFSKVIWVTISKEVNIFRLQNQIAKEVGLDLSHVQDKVERSSLLHEELYTRRGIVFILDDVWKAVSLRKIGIPEFNEVNGSKLVLTSRSLGVCQMMGCKKEIQVELLSELEAWDLFVKTIGVKLSPEVEKIAKDIAEECSRLPLALLTVGGAMRGKVDIGMWRGALADMRQSTYQESEYWMTDLEKKVIGRLKFSYSRMDDETLKKCFLYCALYPEDVEIDSKVLIDNWIMEGLISGKDMKDEWDRGHDVLNKLKQCTMLEDNSKYDEKGIFLSNVKMHDLIRDMALHITKTDPRYMVKAGLTLESLEDEIKWSDDYEKVSLMQSDLSEILVSRNCSGLRTLLLNECILHGIINDFFVQMQGLRVLNLSYTRIVVLPESVSGLINLQVLDLSRCRSLKKVHSLEKLQSLRVLRLCDTAIEEVPHGIEMLINLQRLDLSRTIDLGEISAHVISKLSMLQELLIDYLRISNSNGNTLLSLSHLESVSIWFEDLCDYMRHVENFRHLNYFKFTVARTVFAGFQSGVNYQMSGPNPMRYVAIDSLFASHQIHFNIILPEKTEYLRLEEFDGFTRLSEIACFNNMRELRSCIILYCKEMEYVLVSEEEHYLQHLEKLEIQGCDKLISLFNGVSSCCSFSCLKELVISRCDNLKYLLPSKVFKQLQNLVDIKVENCVEIEQLIISVDDEIGEAENVSDKTTVVLPRLETFYLSNLPKLKSIWNGLMVCNSLQAVEVYDCDQINWDLNNNLRRRSNKYPTQNQVYTRRETVYEAPTNARFVEGMRYAALPLQAENLFPMVEPKTPSSRWSNVTVHEGPPSEDPIDEDEARFDS